MQQDTQEKDSSQSKELTALVGDNFPIGNTTIGKLAETNAQRIFGGKQLLISRPKEMTYDEYRLLRHIQTKVLRSIFRKPTVREVARPMPVRIGYNFHNR